MDCSVSEENVIVPYRRRRLAKMSPPLKRPADHLPRLG
jgi:hypothetical protein